MRVTANVILELSPLEVERLLGVIMDEDRDEALTFLKEGLGRKVEEKLRPHCVPTFEASYARNKKGIIKE